jgi:hypothetical protein
MHEPELCNEGTPLRSPAGLDLQAEVPSGLRLDFRRPAYPGATGRLLNCWGRKNSKSVRAGQH